MAAPMVTMAHALASRPRLNPDNTVVAAPVRVDSTTSRTGRSAAVVKCWVCLASTWASTRPTTTAQNSRSWWA